MSHDKLGYKLIGEISPEESAALDKAFDSGLSAELSNGTRLQKAALKIAAGMDIMRAIHTCPLCQFQPLRDLCERQTEWFAMILEDYFPALLAGEQPEDTLLHTAVEAMRIDKEAMCATLRTLNAERQNGKPAA